MRDYIKINDVEIPIETIAKKFGINELIRNAALCREVPSGTLQAVIHGGDMFNGVNVELHLPESEKSKPIRITRVEQTEDDEIEHREAPTAYLYGRGESYIAFMDIDTRPDKAIKSEPKTTSITVSGDRDDELHVYAENQYTIIRPGNKPE